MITLPPRIMAGSAPRTRLFTRLRRVAAQVSKPERLAWVSAGALMTLGAIAAFLGWYVRPVSDDYRLAIYAREGGPLGTAMVFYSEVSGRVGNGLVEGLVYMWSWGPRLTALLAFAGLAAAVAYLVQGLLRMRSVETSLLTPWVAGLGVATVTHLDQPRLYHTLFWATGAITHVLPPLLLTAFIAVAIRVHSRRARRNLLIASIPVGLAIATFSEPIILAWFVLAGLCVATHLFFVRRVTFSLILTATLSVGFMAGAAIVITSPGHAATREVRTHGEALISQQIFADALAGWQRAMAHLLANSSLLTAVAVGILVSVLVGRCRWPELTSARIVWALLAPIVSVLASALLVMWALRVGWGPGGWSFYRGWFIFSFLAVMALAWLGFVFGQFMLSALRSVPVSRILAGASCVVILVGALTYIGELNTLGRRIVPRSVAWDRLDARTLRAVSRGQRVVEYKDTPIAELAQPFSGRRWVAKYIATYYGVDSIVKERN